ncbi:hypothetical protein DFH29DRAFT_927224 [Suillus ampliporus]|nr:hypothetical protein DFH29DRAFT_927224 [Suillus ampliporus]
MYRSTAPNPSSTSWLEQATDQESMRLTLQSCLDCLERHNDSMVGIYREILEIRIRITELVASCQSEVAVGNSGAWDDTVDLQAIINDGPQTIVPESLAFYDHLLDPEYPLESVGISGTLPEGADPLIDPLLCDTSGHGTYSERQTLSDFSLRRNQQRPLPIVQRSKDTVKCTQPNANMIQHG